MPNACANLGPAAKIKRRPCYRCDLSSGNERRIHRRERAGVERQHVIENLAARRAVQVPVRVLREIDRRGFIGCRFVIHYELIARRKGVCHARLERSWKAFLSILARVAQRDAGAAVVPARLPDPQDPVESTHPAMQRVRAVVFRKLISGAVERELALGNPIGVAADDCTEVRRVFEVSTEAVEAEHDVVEVAGAVRCADDGDDAAVRHHANLDAVRIRERKELDAAAIRQLSEWRPCPHRVAKHEEHGGINRVAPESRAIDCQSTGQRRINVQPNDHLTGAGTLANRVSRDRHAQQLAV